MRQAENKKFEVVLFDLGNTLLYFDGNWEQVIAEMDAALLHSLQGSGLVLREQEFLKQVEARFAEYDAQKAGEFLEFTTTFIVRGLLTDQGYPEVPEPTLQRAIRAMYAVSQAHWQREADALPTLQTLREQGYRLGMISNAGDDQDVQMLVDQAGLRSYFEVILTSAAQGIRKPNPRIFQRALQHWGTPPVKAVMVGDTLGADILGARNTGISSVWITRRASPNQPHQDTIHPDAKVEVLSALPELLASL